MARILISMPDEFLDSIDNFAQVEQRSRSELIREALRGYIRKNSMNTINEKAMIQAQELERVLE